MTAPELPGRDRRAVRIPGPQGADQVSAHVAVVGGGIAGLAAATVLAERGVRVTLLESDARLGGRVAAWPVAENRTMSRGFHAFFRQYYNLRALLRRIDPGLGMLQPVEDYPLVRPDGVQDSFRSIPKSPPWSVLGFVAKSPTFTVRSLARVNVPAALELLKVRFPGTPGRPGTYEQYEGESAAAFLDRLRFPAAARDLALEVFARSFFADPRDFAAGELVAMFHTYFMGSAEGLLFDVPVDDYDLALWDPLGRYLAEHGVAVRTQTRVTSLEPRDDGATVHLEGQDSVEADAVVLATDPRQARLLAATIDSSAAEQRRWLEGVSLTTNAPPFVVVRLWFDGEVASHRAPFLGTSGFGPLDNVTVLERFERGAARWSAREGGSVVELHAYAAEPTVLTDDSARDALVARLEQELHRVYPETAALGVRHREVLVRDDCTLIGPHGWRTRPGVTTPWPSLVMAGDWVRCDYPVALMERAATTGFQAANVLLERRQARGQDLWTVPLRGLLNRDN